MISTDSRYVNASVLVEEHDVPVTVGNRTTTTTRSSVYTVRNFPSPMMSHNLYTWKETDRLDRIAARFLGDPRLWWRILDINPIIQDPHDISPGEQIRIPKNA